ncbi:methylenetetrahydrofolate reductase [Plutella xylostella]|uniref:methylenetetrahydrofolate reductase n=1 Tax=Plutella xylostella TaxID=51655 RepID=UPI0020328D96|nr:methylenetetrahydrofolate reductase [Plutella xylostella]
MTSNKITDLLKQDSETISLEVTPDLDVKELLKLNFKPLFVSITWHARMHHCEDLDIAPLRLASRLKSEGYDVLLHISCDQLKRTYLDQVLNYLKERGICNLFVVQGERYNPIGSEFASSKELIAYIRKETAGYFCIGVAGYPGDESRLPSLKDKVESGADFVITQAFFEYPVYSTFLDKCKEIGTQVPIIPGIFLFDSPQQLLGFANLCKVNVPQSLMQYAESGGTTVTGHALVSNMIEEITSATKSKFHFFTLNRLQNVCDFLEASALLV